MGSNLFDRAISDRAYLDRAIGEALRDVVPKEVEKVLETASAVGEDVILGTILAAKFGKGLYNGLDSVLDTGDVIGGLFRIGRD